MVAIPKSYNPIKLMCFAVRLMDNRDAKQASDIERDAFPTSVPTTRFKAELKKHRSSYMVAYVQDNAARSKILETGSKPDRSSYPLVRHISPVIDFWKRIIPTSTSTKRNIVGILGIWYGVDEAHIVSIGVKQQYRGQGVGELLLIAAIEQAMVKPVEVVTLEVRMSNHVAITLYTKYGFSKRGVRKHYYTDNQEDALIMTTGSINREPFSKQFHNLVKDHERNWGRSKRVLN